MLEFSSAVLPTLCSTCLWGRCAWCVH